MRNLISKLFSSMYLRNIQLRETILISICYLIEGGLLLKEYSNIDITRIAEKVKQTKVVALMRLYGPKLEEI